MHIPELKKSNTYKAVLDRCALARQVRGDSSTLYIRTVFGNIVPHRPPLTAARLAQIWDENPDPVVLELLWEIHRLRATISRANQVRNFIGARGHGAVPSSVWECFIRELDTEPCLTDKPTPRQEAVVERILTRPSKSDDR